MLLNFGFTNNSLLVTLKQGGGEVNIFNVDPR